MSERWTRMGRTSDGVMAVLLATACVSVDGARAEIERVLNRLSARDRSRVIELVRSDDDDAAVPARVETAIAGAIETALEVFAREIVARMREPRASGAPRTAPPAKAPARSAPKSTTSARTRPTKAARDVTAPKAAKDSHAGDTRSAFLAYVAAHPGNRLEDIARALDESTLTIKPVAALLREQSLVRCEGRTRATRYFPA